jgi:hypothetical protein
MRITIEEKNLSAAYEVADENTKKVLDALFGRTVPDYSDYRNIKTYEDACASLGEPPDVQFENVPDHIFALMKLETISCALWGKDFQPEPDADSNEYYYYPWFALYSKKEINNMSTVERSCLLSARATSGATAGFGCLGTTNRSSDSHAHFGFRLCQETPEKALYFGQQFITLWAEYLKFNFEIKEDEK